MVPVAAVSDHAVDVAVREQEMDNVLFASMSFPSLELLLNNAEISKRGEMTYKHNILIILVYRIIKRFMIVRLCTECKTDLTGLYDF